MKIGIINGPNLNLLGKREPEVYGNLNFETYLEELKSSFPKVELTYFQSNIEGELIDALQQLSGEHDAIVLNAASYTHTSIGIGDAVAAINTPVMEVHISNVYQRESFRQHSYVAPHAYGVISGLGIKGYELAIKAFLNQ